MGKATILSHIGDGQYRIRIKFDNTLIELRKTYIDQQIVAINTELTTLNTQKLAAKIQYDADIAALNDYIDNTPVQDYVSNPTDINALTVQVYKSRFAYDAVIRLEKHAKLKRTQLSKDKDYLVNYCPADYETTAWCTEYKTDLSGDVNTIEIDYGHRRDPFTDVTKNDTGFWIVNESTYPQAGNNQLQHPFESSVHACWYNLAMLPAMQRDKALFRVATILDKATGFIEFDGQSEPNNFDPVLITEKPVFPAIGFRPTGVRLLYPQPSLYENGDRVIVEMQPADNGGMAVIGFHDHPRQVKNFTTIDYAYGGSFIFNYKSKPVVFGEPGHDPAYFYGGGRDTYPLNSVVFSYLVGPFDGGTTGSSGLRWSTNKVPADRNPLNQGMWDYLTNLYSISPGAIESVAFLANFVPFDITWPGGKIVKTYTWTVNEFYPEGYYEIVTQYFPMTATLSKVSELFLDYSETYPSSGIYQYIYMLSFTSPPPSLENEVIWG